MNILNKNGIVLLVIIMKINLSSWMKEIDSDKKLFEMTIPGTHDCTTQYVQLPHISRCQNLSICEQLKIGIRSLDIRVASSKKRLKLVHGIAKVFNTPNRFGKQMDLEDVLASCYSFLNENPSETIIFQFKNDSNKENEVCFDNLFHTYIQPNREKWYCENRIPALSEARGKLVLLRRCRLDNSNKQYTPLNSGIDFSKWVEQDWISPEPLTLKTESSDNAVFIIQDRFKYKPEARWTECLKPFLDSADRFDGNYIINYTSTAGGLKGPENNAKIINTKLMHYDFDKANYYGTIYLDFPDEALTSKLIEHNF